MAVRKITGVYKVQCLKNGKVYIGSSESVYDNWYRHKSSMKNSYGRNNYLQTDWDLYGADSFRMDVLEICTEDVLKKRENYWISVYNSGLSERGYNINDAETRRPFGPGFNRMPTVHNPIVCIYKDGSVTHYDNNRDLIEGIGIPDKHIKALLDYWEDGRGSKKSWHGYIVVRKKTYKSEFDYINYTCPSNRVLKPKVEKVIKPFEDRDLKRCSIITVDTVTGHETTYRSIKECVEQLNLLKPKVFKCLNNEFGKYQHRGLFFKRAL